MTEVSLIDVPSRWTHYVEMDDMVLFGKYMTCVGTVPPSMSRHFMTEAIVRYELGNEIVDKYLDELRKSAEFEWRATLEIHK